MTKTSNREKYAATAAAAANTTNTTTTTSIAITTIQILIQIRIIFPAVIHKSALFGLHYVPHTMKFHNINRKKTQPATQQ